MDFLRTFESNKLENMLALGTYGGGIGSYVFVVDHLHEPKFSERPFCICLILKWLHKLLDCHLLPPLCVQSRAGGRREQRDEDTGHY